ncbi:DUF2382 domain-containing protein [Allobranchiibius sp. CTAmp26]|uniref:DUF2382 domain-containing protein n=1 Tax=Allobranchiibius sp. CTAmp26 TaxID=2815214 RepID=UPI001AA0C34E|nr:PRC and DUF2382 domain-containing protein [Allobranchiibius sp. CTAmp26]MBO1756498.1 PRC and DUF2382 domain-containing protein [Allobranchiibius sp. CTAmp26]
MISTEQIQTLIGGNAIDNEGAKIGSVGQIYLDDQSGQPEWVTVKTGLFGTSETFIPLRDAQVEGEDLKLPYSKSKVKDAPRMDDAEQHLDVEQEQKLYEYYGLDYNAPVTTGRDNGGRDAGGRDFGRDHHEGLQRDDDRRDRTGEAGIVGQDTSGPTTDEAMTRSEERLNVGTEQVETGRARLRKYVVTENVTTTVPVSHEEVRVVREPITEENRGDALSGGDLTEEEHEVTLHAEQPVVNKETVPVERVKLDTETVTGEQEVTEQVRKEQIETDAADGDTGLEGRGNNNR